MSIEESAVEAAVSGKIDVPVDIYVGINVVRQHVAEFFYRAKSQGILGSDETALAIFDCVILDREGRRLGGLTLHDYAVITDQHLITWGRGRNKDIVDRFPWEDLNLDKMGRRNAFEGVIKFNYLLKPVGNKRKISLKGHDARVETTVQAPAKNRGTSLYLDLMPAGEVKVCAEMMQFFISAVNGEPTAGIFKEHFRADITRSQERLSNISIFLRPFYLDMGNGMLVEAGEMAEPRAGKAGPVGGSAVREEIRHARPEPRPARPAPPPPPAAPEPAPTSTAGDYSMSGNVPVIGANQILNTGNRPTDTIRGVSRNNDTMRGAGSGGSKENSLYETASLNTNPYNGPSKLDSYEGRVTGRAPSGGQSRLTQVATPAPVARIAPPVEKAPAPRPVRENIPPAARITTTRIGASGSVMPPATHVTPPALPIQNKTRLTLSRVRQEVAEIQDSSEERPLVMPIGIALVKGSLNIYSISRLTRGLWIDPRNITRNITDLSQTIGALGDIADVVTTDEGARNVALRRLRISANTSLGNNIIFHYTVWPFIKPIIDALSLPATWDKDSQVTRRISVRKLDDETIELTDETPAREVTGDSGLVDLGPAAGKDTATVTTAKPVQVHVAEPPVATAKHITVKEELAEDSGPSLNVSGKGNSDPTAGLDQAPEKNEPTAPKSKLDDLKS
ncbi:MAG TPA: hypothetical protein VH186_02905 [Chloroflexia bacterium]|nr:hypothetical protein [Chloroflexia bacterium]